MRIFVCKYVLDDKYKQDSLPHDFVDLDNKIITWHSDNDNNSSLELMYENNAIVLCDHIRNRSPPERTAADALAWKGMANRIRIGKRNKRYGGSHVRQGLCMDRFALFHSGNRATAGHRFRDDEGRRT